MIKINIDFYSILQNINNIDFFIKLWIFAWVIILLGSFCEWEDCKDTWPFGIIVLYIMFYPLYRRWDVLLSGRILQCPSFWLSFFILIVLILFWLVLFIKILPDTLNFFIEKNILKESILENKIICLLLNRSTNEESKIKKLINNFSIIWLSWIQVIFHLPMHQKIIDNLLSFFNKTMMKKGIYSFGIWFLALVLLPRLIITLVLFYDIIFFKQLYFFPKISLFIVVALLTRMLFLLAEKAVSKRVSELNQLLYVSSEEDREENDQQGVINLPPDDEGNQQRILLYLRKHLRYSVNFDTYAKWRYEYICCLNSFINCTLFRIHIYTNLLPKGMLLVFTLEIVLRIIIIYH